MKLLKFKSYADYVLSQERRNRNKINMVAASKRELDEVVQMVLNNNPNPSYGLCHGVRNGFEVCYLKERTNMEVLGTEISSTASQFENVIQWDFHEIKEEWIGKFDFIYSNSWDHAFDPDKMLDSWIKCLKENGRCYLQWTDTHAENTVSGADCFGLSLGEMKDWISKKYKVEKIKTFYEFSILNPSRWMINLIKRPRPGIRGRKINLVVIMPKV